MIQVSQNFSISRLNNPEVTAFYVNVQKAISSSTPEKLGIGELLTAYNAKLQELIDRVYVSQGSEFTAAMKAADDRRCLIFRRIRLRLQMVEVAEQNEALLACQDVVRTHLLTKYVAGVTARAYQERTSILKGFILDLREKLDEAAIAALGLGQDITALEEANNAFIDAYAQRAAEKAEGNLGVTACVKRCMTSTCRSSASCSIWPTRPTRRMPRRPPLASRSLPLSTCCSATRRNVWNRGPATVPMEMAPTAARAQVMLRATRTMAVVEPPIPPLITLAAQAAVALVPAIQYL